MIQPSHKPIKISFNESIKFLHFLKEDKQFMYEADQKREVFTASDHLNERVFDFRLPLPLPFINEMESLIDFATRLDKYDYPPNYLVVLMQAGQSALGYFEEGEMLNHKVIRKYMVRKKRGKSQLSYLKTKGKSRAGSRVRLAETEEFFEEINEKIIDWEVADLAEKILYSCPVRMWPMLFEARVEAPFDQRDNRLKKIPMDVDVPGLEELIAVNKFALAGTITLYKPIAEDFYDFRQHRLS